MILDLGLRRLSVPQTYQAQWMMAHQSFLPPNALWTHEHKVTSKTGDLRFRQNDRFLHISGRNCHLHLDKLRDQIHSCCDDEFYVDLLLRYYDISLRVKEGQLATHAAAIQKNGKTWILAGYSNAGKSTSSDLAESVGWLKMQDDLVFLKNGHIIDSVDWNNKLRAKQGKNAKVRGVVLLEQASDHRLTRISYQEALRRLGPIWGFPQLQDPTQWLEFLDRELREIPVFVLRFRKNAGFAQLLEQC